MNACLVAVNDSAVSRALHVAGIANDSTGFVACAIGNDNPLVADCLKNALRDRQMLDEFASCMGRDDNRLVPGLQNSVPCPS